MILNLSLAVVNVASALVIYAYLIKTMCGESPPKTIKFALWIGVIGLLWQSFISFYFFLNNEFFLDEELPLWVLKDAGYWVIAGYIVMRFVRK